MRLAWEITTQGEKCEGFLLLNDHLQIESKGIVKRINELNHFRDFEVRVG